MAEEETIHQGTSTTEEEVKAQIEARMQAAFEKAQAKEQPEIAAPTGWWNLWAVGPYKVPGLQQPNKVIRAGEKACVATVLWLNPGFSVPGVGSACSLLSTLACNFEIKYCTGNLCSWQPGPAALNVTREVELKPDRCWYVDSLCFTPDASWEGCYEMHICGNIKGCNKEVPTPFAGFVTWVYDIDADLLYPSGGPGGAGPHWQFEIPIRFMVAP
jgi:hypothetical protein